MPPPPSPLDAISAGHTHTTHPPLNHPHPRTRGKLPSHGAFHVGINGTDYEIRPGRGTSPFSRFFGSGNQVFSKNFLQGIFLLAPPTVSRRVPVRRTFSLLSLRVIMWLDMPAAGGQLQSCHSPTPPTWLAPSGLKAQKLPGIFAVVRTIFSAARVISPIFQKLLVYWFGERSPADR